LDALDEYIKLSYEERRAFPKNFEWCVKTFKHIEQQIKSTMLYSERETDDVDRRAAAHTLVYVLNRALDCNVDHKHNNPNDGSEIVINLCDSLIKESKSNYILDVLDKFPSECIRQLVPELCQIEKKATGTGIPETYLDKLQGLISRLRNTDSSSGSGPESEAVEGSRKRTSEDYDRSSKRVK
jgi:hypothetical protein